MNNNKKYIALNKQSAIDCETEEQEQIHNEEVLNVLDTLWKLNARCIYTIKRTDIYEKAKWGYLNSQDVEDVLLSCDFKNGMDAYINISKDNKEYLFIVWGQGYTYMGEYRLVQTRLRLKVKGA